MLSPPCQPTPVRDGWSGLAAGDVVPRNSYDKVAAEQHTPRRPNLSVVLPNGGAVRQPITLYPIPIAFPPPPTANQPSLSPPPGSPQSSYHCLCYGVALSVPRPCSLCSAMTSATASAYLHCTPTILLRLLRHQRHVRAVEGGGAVSSDDVPEPLSLTLPSAVLLIDLSGFTSLTESFAQGVASGGLEQLTDLVNAHFASILDVIRAHKGDLLKVAGDALIVAFYQLDDEPACTDSVADPLPLLCLRALRSALALQSASAFTAAGVTLRLHVGVTCGLTDYVAVGGAEQTWTVGSQPGDSPAAAPSSSIAAQKMSDLSPLELPLDVKEEAILTAADCPKQLPSADSVSPRTPNRPHTSPLPELLLKKEEEAAPSVLLSQYRPLPLSVGHRSSTSLSPPVSAQSDGGSRWEFLAVGPAFDQLRSAVSDSKTGQIVCSAQVWKQTAQIAILRGQQVRGGESDNWLVDDCQPRERNTTADEPSSKDKPNEQSTVSDRFAAGGGGGTAHGNSSAAFFSSSASSVPTLSSFLMPALLFRFQTRLSSPSHWLGEYRKVNVLLIALPNPTRCNLPVSAINPTPPTTQSTDDAAAEEANTHTLSSSSSTSTSTSDASIASSSSSSWLWTFHRLVRALQRCIIRMGGQVRQLVVDDKGCVMIGAFGLPPLAQEDDATRALTAALDILTASRALLPPSLSSSVSIGITTGRAWCGAVGSETRKEYAVVGDIVNLSARIMSNSVTASRALCDEETMKASDGHIQFNSTVHYVNLKGKTGLFPLYEPLRRARPSISRTASLLSSPYGSPPLTFRFGQLPRPAPVPPRALSVSSRSSPVGPSSSVSSRGSLSASVSPPSSPASASRFELESSPLHFHVLGHAEAIRLSSRDQALDYMAALMLPDNCRSAAEKAEQQVDAAAPLALPVVMLEGEAGAGKSYLTSQLVDVCRSAGMLVLLGHADSMESNTPLFAVIAILQEIVRVEVECQRAREELPSVDPNFSALQSLLPPSEHLYVSLLLPFLPECVPLKAYPAVAVEASMQASLTRRLMRSMISSHCERHTQSVLIIEDGHWLDLQSWTLMREVTELLSSVRLLITCRPIAAPVVTTPDATPPPSAWTMFVAITEHPRCHHVVLAGMDLPAAGKVATAFLECTALTPSLADIIHERSDGVPLFILHLCSFMRDSRLVSVSVTTGVASLDERMLAGNSLPMSLEGLLISILDRLHPDCQLTLKVASVVGRRFSCSLVAACHPFGLSAGQVQALMIMAEQQRIVKQDGLTRDPLQDEDESIPYDVHYRFTHQLVRDAAYSSLLYQRRRELHAMVADQLVRQQQLEQQQHQHRSISAHLLAHHYWLSLCMADDVLLDSPGQRLLGCAVVQLLNAALASRQSGTPDAVSLLMRRAARGLTLMQAGDLRDVQQERWLFLLMGGELLYNMPLVVMLAVASGDAKPEETVTPALGSRCVRLFSIRLLALLSSPAVLQTLSPSEIENRRFVSLYSLWFSSLPLGAAAVAPTFDALSQFAQSAEGPDAGYYQLEVLRAAFSTYAQAHNAAGSLSAYTQLEKHPFYLEMLDGSVKLTKFTIGHSPMSSLVPNQALFQWETGRVNVAEATLRRVMPMILATEHQPSITQALSQLLKVSLQMNSSALTVSLLQQVIHSFPAHDSRAGHLLYTYRQCAMMALRVWDEPGRSLLSSDELSGVSYESDLLALIGQLMDEGGLLGMSFYIIIHSFPWVVDFRPEVPAAIHDAVLRLVSKYHSLFSFNGFDIELRRLQALALLRQIRAGQGDRQQLAAEAEQLLSSALQLVHYEKLLTLKLQMSWLELRLQMNEREAAERELRAALADFPEAEDGVAFHVRRAKEWLAEIATDGTVVSRASSIAVQQ